MRVGRGVCCGMSSAEGEKDVMHFLVAFLRIARNTVVVMHMLPVCGVQSASRISLKGKCNQIRNNKFPVLPLLHSSHRLAPPHAAR